MSNPSSITVWLLALVAFAPFAVLMLIELIYRRGHRQGLDYEYSYRDEDFADGEQDLHAWRHIREEQE